ncbi:MAG: transglutaminase family protein [Chloroflexi bacterium]|nr:transglutaminase family protein [Chloroflexota bacterium]
MRLAIRYVSRFRYPEPAWDSHNVLRACPTSDPHQRLLDYQLDVEPSARVTTYVDAWGTRVDELGVRDRHRELRVVARSTVETTARPAPDAGEVTDGLDALRAPDFRDAHWVFLQPTRHAGMPSSVTELARTAAEGASCVIDLVDRVHATVHGSLAYRPGHTYVGVDVGEVLTGGMGVCQDFVHLGLAMYRSLGVPARYVSGYFYARDGTDGEAPETAEVTVQTHAWLEVAIPGWGWWALDPTNHLTAGERHVKIGHGRDYDDVLPLRGVYYGTSEQHLDVEVGMSRGELSALAPFQEMQQQQ